MFFTFSLPSNVFIKLVSILSKKHFITSDFASNDDRVLIVTEKNSDNKLVSQFFDIGFSYAVMQQMDS